MPNSPVVKQGTGGGDGTAGARPANLYVTTRLVKDQGLYAADEVQAGWALGASQLTDAFQLLHPFLS